MGEGETQVYQAPQNLTPQNQAPQNQAPQNQAPQRAAPPPNQPTAAPRTRGSRVGLILAGLVVVAVLVLAALVYASNQQIASAAAVARAYCSDLQAKQYTDAYTLLAPSAQTATSKQTFALSSADADAIDGPVSSCVLPKAGFALLLAPVPSSASVAATITRQQARSGSILMAYVQGSWRVTGTSTGLRGTDVMPLVTAQTYCQDLAQGDYTSAYASTTAAYQARVGSVSSYGAAIKSALTQAQASIQGCQMRMDTYAVNSGDTSASVQWSLNIMVGTIATPTTQTVTLLKDDGTWKIDSIG